jgi:sensor histidine kinase regulating citrate/malate metabolism
VRNGTANALDVSQSQGLAVAISWGQSDRDFWISIIDYARALPRNIRKLFEFGTTTKAGHIGAGLALVEQAALALGGTVALSTATDGATQLVVQWPRPRT